MTIVPIIQLTKDTKNWINEY